MRRLFDEFVNRGSRATLFELMRDSTAAYLRIWFRLLHSPQPDQGEEAGAFYFFRSAWSIAV
jgi:hypothetical protein